MMEIRVLGCHGSQLPGCGLTGFLIDATTLVDAGAVTSVLTLEEQGRLEHILITHAHLDHIRELSSLADNICYCKRDFPLTVVGTAGVIEQLRTHIFNGSIWPDFSVIPSAENPVLRFQTVRPGEATPLGRLRVMAVPVHHTVETVAYVVDAGTDRGAPAAVFIGDTGPTEEIWRIAGQDRIRAIFVEASLPGDMEDLARLTGHLTPARLVGELNKLGRANHPQIYLYHMKIQYLNEIRREVSLLGNDNIQLLSDGQIIRI